VADYDYPVADTQFGAEGIQVTSMREVAVVVCVQATGVTHSDQVRGYTTS